MKQFLKKTVAVILTGVLLAGVSLTAAAAPEDVNVAPVVTAGEASV